MDIRLQHLSYSSLLTLHTCPRKFQLDKLNAEKESFDLDGSQSLTFAYGHAVGTGIQLLLQRTLMDEVIWQTFLNWNVDLALDNPKQKKSFYLAVIALMKFEGIAAAYLKDYDLVIHEGQPAVELSFSITLPDGFKYRGFVDAVLRHRETGEVVVLECKTSSATNINAAQYKNSSQAVGYSVVLDVIAPDVSSYRVFYLPYKTKSGEYELFTFPKSYLQRALWIQELLLDVELVKMYEGVGIYPMRGESCFSFYRECEYYNTCTLSNQFMTKVMTAEEEERFQEKEATYQIQLTLKDLIDAQLAKGSLPQTTPTPPTTTLDIEDILL
jgi:hypothetical protein